jgi:hypothetical protein
MKPKKHYLCPGCDQPMLPKGEEKVKDFYDHATGCPLSYAPVYLERETASLAERVRTLEEILQRIESVIASAEMGKRAIALDQIHEIITEARAESVLSSEGESK